MRVGFSPGGKAEPVRSRRGVVRPLPFVNRGRIVQFAGAQPAGAVVIGELHREGLAGAVHKRVVASHYIRPLAIALAADAESLWDASVRGGLADKEHAGIIVRVIKVIDETDPIVVEGVKADLEQVVFARRRRQEDRAIHVRLRFQRAAGRVRAEIGQLHERAMSAHLPVAFDRARTRSRERIGPPRRKPIGQGRRFPVFAEDV